MDIDPKSLKAGDFEVVTLPPAYSERAMAERERLLIELTAFDEEYRERTRPLYERLAEIEAMHQPRYMLAPKAR